MVIKNRANKRFWIWLKRLWSKRFGVIPLSLTLDSLSAWFGGALGEAILTREKALVDEQLSDLFGFHLMQLSVADSVCLTKNSRIAHRFSLYPKLTQKSSFLSAEFKHSAVCDFSHLPLPPNSIDLVVMHHLLDYSQNPHQLLREVSTVLVSHGNLLVIGFNPWSLLGFRRWIMRWFSRAPQWRHQALSAGRVVDWLRVLDLTPISVEQGFYLPFRSSKSESWLARFEAWCGERGLPCGGFYLIVARKDSFALTPQKPQWQTYTGFQWGVTKILGRVTRNQKLSQSTKNTE